MNLRLDINSGEEIWTDDTFRFFDLGVLHL